MIDYVSIQVTEPENPTEPVTLAEAKAWANVDFADDDALITSMISDARQDIERLTNRSLVEKEVTVNVVTCGIETIRLPYGSVSDLSVTDNETDETLDEDEYKVSGAMVKVNYGGRFGFSYTSGSVIPGALKQAIKMLVAYRYNNRGDQEAQTGIPDDVLRKCDLYQEVWL